MIMCKPHYKARYLITCKTLARSLTPTHTHTHTHTCTQTRRVEEQEVAEQSLNAPAMAGEADDDNAVSVANLRDRG